MIGRRIVAPLTVAVAVAAGGAVGALIGIPALSGAQESPTTTPSSSSGTGTAFDHGKGGALLDAAAKALGMSTQDLAGKLSDGTTTIADVAQQRGVDLNKVVDAMAGEARDRITQMVHEPWRKFGHERHGPGRFGGASLDAAAKALGVSTDDLLTELRAGKTIAQVARDKGVDPQKVIDALVADAQTRLDRAVADGRITQQEADRRKAELKDRITQMVDSGFPGPRAFGRFRGGPPLPPSPDGPPGNTPSGNPSI